MTEVIPKLEENLKAVTTQRENTRTLITKIQDDLTKMFAKAPKKPRSSMAEIENTLKELENKRTRTSLSLTEEKQLLKQINSAERDKRQMQECLDFDKKVQLKRTQVKELRDAIKPLTDKIADCEKALSKARLANKLGCHMDEMQKAEMECPPDKIGRVIGKNGAMIKKLEEIASVSLDVEADRSVVVISGNPSSFPLAKEEIRKIIDATQQDIEVPPELMLFLTKGNHVAEKLRETYPGVHFELKNNATKIPARGLPEDIANLKHSLFALGVVKQERQLTSAEAMLVIGKKGANIDKVTDRYKLAIEVEKQDNERSLCIVAGPEADVEAAMKEIDALLNANKEVTRGITCSKAITQAFLTAGGVRIKDLQKKISESTKSQNAGTVLLSFDQVSGDSSELIIKGKNAAMSTAVAMVGESIREIDNSTVRIMADRHAIPQVIGRGGETIKSMKEGKKVNIEVDRKTGEVAINGLDQAEVAEVEARVLAIINENKVQKIPVDPSIVDLQYRELIRSKTRQEVTDLARLDIDKAESIILLRGCDENVHKAADVVRTFLDSNYIQMIEITDADKDALLAGGQKSKIVAFAKQLEVHLSVDKDNMAVMVRGTIDKVKAAVKHLNAYLYGGEGNICTKITVAKEALGIVIGKGGKARKALEEKFPGVSVYVNRSGDAITLRGPEENATNCRFEILKMIASARITQEIPITEKQVTDLNKSNILRRIAQQIPVQCSLKESTIEVRGISPDVRDAVALIHEHLTGDYESYMELGSSAFAKIRGASRDESHFARMKSSTGADVKLDIPKASVLIRGKRNNVKKAKFQVLDFLEFLVPGELRKIKLPKAMHSTVGQPTTLIDVATVTGATIALDRDLSMIIAQSSDKESVEEATRLLQAKVTEAEKLVFVFEFDTTEAWLIPIIIGKNGSRINAVRKQSGCNIDISKEERTVVISGATEDAVTAAKASISEAVESAKKENLFVEVPYDAMPRFVGKGGAHIDGMRKKYNVELETTKKGSSKFRIQGAEGNVKAAKDAIEAWVAEWAKPEEKKEIKIDRHHISAILGKGGVNIQALQEESGCRIDVDRENLMVVFRGDPATQELALRKIEEIMAETPIPERTVNKSRSESDDEVNSGSQVEQPKKAEKEKGQKPASVDIEEKADRTSEFPSLPVGIAQTPKRKKRNKKAKGGARGTPTKSVGSTSCEESSVGEGEGNVAKENVIVVNVSA